VKTDIEYLLCQATINIVTAMFWKREHT